MAENVFYPYPGYVEVVGFNSKRSQAEEKLQGIIDSNSSLDNAQSEDIAKNTESINAEVERSIAADAEFESALAKEIEERKRMGGILNGKVADEATARENADIELQNAINEVSSNVSGAFDLVDEKIKEEVSKLESKIAEEAKSREESDASLNESISNEATIRDKADADLNDLINGEINERKEETSNLLSEITDEKEERKANDDEIKDSLNLEKIERTASYNELLAKIEEETNNRTTKDDLLTQENELIKSELNQVKDDYRFADTSIINQVKEEKKNRENTDATLQSSIDILNENIKSVDANYKIADNEIRKLIEETSNNAKSYKLAEVVDDELSVLGTNVNKAWKLVDEDGEKSGEYIIDYKDSTLKNVSFENETLIFTYILSDGSEDVVEVNVSSFLSENEFKNGLQVIDGVVSVKLDDSTESFLSVLPSGVKLSGVQTAINSAKNEAKSYADNLNTIESNRAKGVEESLKSTIDAEVARSIARDDAFTSSLATEKTDRFNADDELRTSINEISSSYLTADIKLQNAINAEVANRTSEISRLETLISTEQSERQSKDSSLDQQITLLSTNVSKLGNDYKDADAELSNKINEEVSKATKSITALESSISNEVTARSNADATIQSSLDNLTLRVDKVEAKAQTDYTTLNAAIESEKAERINLENSVNTSIDTATNAITSIDTAYKNADAVLQSNINSEATARDDADKLLQKNIDDEATLRENSDTTLQTNIDNEATLRENSDTELQGNIDDEIAARESADATLQTNIDDEVAARENAVNALNETISGIVNSVNETISTNINAEAKAREDADTALEGKIDKLDKKVNAIEVDYQTADKTLEDSIKTETANREALGILVKGISEKINSLEEELALVKEQNAEMIEEIESLKVIVNTNDVTKTIQNLKSGDSVTLTLNSDLDFVNENFTIPQGASLTIDLNGKNITHDGDLIFFRVNGDLTINGEGNFEGNSYFASANQGSKVTVNGGNYECSVTCFQSNGGDVIINDGYFNIKDEDSYGNVYTLNFIDSMKTVGTISVKGGTFVNYNPSNSKSENPPMNFVADGYGVVESIDENGNYIYNVIKANEVSNAEDFVSVLSSLKDDEQVVVKLTNNLTVGENEKIVINGDVTIDLNGNNISYEPKYNILFRVNGSLNINGNGSITTNSYIASANEGSVVTVSNGTFNAYTTCFQSNGGILNIEGGYYSACSEEDGCKYTLNFIDSMKEVGQINVKGGSFVNYDPSNSNSENPPMNFVAEGYKSVETIEDGVSIFVVTKE